MLSLASSVLQVMHSYGWNSEAFRLGKTSMTLIKNNNNECVNISYFYEKPSIMTEHCLKVKSWNWQ